MNKPAKPIKACDNCMYSSQHQCLDSEGKPILKYDASGNQYVKLEEPYWTYVECKKNFGLPKVCYTEAKNCVFYKLKEIK